MIQDRTSVFPKAFIELAFDLPYVLKVALPRHGVGDFSSFVGCKKRIVCLTLSKKRTVKGSWVVVFFNSCSLLTGSIFVRQCRVD